LVWLVDPYEWLVLPPARLAEDQAAAGPAHKAAAPTTIAVTVRIVFIADLRSW
jgi:hypothetical protein